MQAAECFALAKAKAKAKAKGVQLVAVCWKQPQWHSPVMVQPLESPQGGRRQVVEVANSWAVAVAVAAAVGNVGFGFFQKNGFHWAFDDLHKLARKPRIDGPKQQPVQYNHRSQPDHILSGCSLPVGVIYHAVNTLSRMKPFQMWACYLVVISELKRKLL